MRSIPLLWIWLLPALSGVDFAQVHVSGAHEIDGLEPALSGQLANNERFGSALTSIADLDGDGRDELVVGVPRASLGGAGAGVVWILFLQADGSVGSALKIGENAGGFNVLLDPSDNFGEGMAAISDLDGDGREELVVSAPGDDDGGPDQGAVWVLFPDAAGTVQDWQKISRTVGGFTAGPCYRLGTSVARVGDLDGDGLDELAVSTGPTAEQLFLLFLNADGTVRSNLSIPRPSGSSGQDGFGGSLAGPGDLNQDGVPDLLVGANYRYRTSAFYTLFLASSGSVLSSTKVSWSAGGFSGETPEEAPLASSLAALGDLEGDGELDFAMGTCFRVPCSGQPHCDNPGSAWIAGIRPDGTVGVERQVSEGSGGIGPFHPGDVFGSAVARVPDLDGNGMPELAIGAPFDDGTGPNQGAVWIAFLEPPLSHPPARRRVLGASEDRTASVPATSGLIKLSNRSGGIPTPLHAYSRAGFSVAAIGDLDDDGHADLALGTPGMDNGFAVDAGGFRILFLDERNTVRSEAVIPATQFGGSGNFAWSLAALGDHDGDAVEDLAVSCPGLDLVWIAFLNDDGSVRSSVRISDALPPPPFPGGEYLYDYGAGLADLGDIDGDGIDDLALLDAGGSEFEGASKLFVVFLNADGTVKSYIEHGFGPAASLSNPISCASIGDLDGDGRGEVAIGDSYWSTVRVFFLNANGTIRSQSQISGPPSVNFGTAVAGAGDLDFDGIEDLVVSAPKTDGYHGACWVLHLHADGSLKSSLQLQAPRGLDAGDEFGSALAFLGDPDGVPSVVVGARGDDDANTNSGAAWIVELR